MAEAVPAGTRGEYQKPSKANTRSKLKLTLGRLKPKWRKSGTRLNENKDSTNAGGQEKLSLSPLFL
jgi:hypothetical protein